MANSHEYEARNRRIVSSYLDPDGPSFREIAEAEGISHERVRQILDEHGVLGKRPRKARKLNTAVCQVVEPEPCGREFTVPIGMSVRDARYCPEHRGKGFVNGRMPSGIKRVCAVVEPEPCGREFTVKRGTRPHEKRYCPEHRGKGYFRGRLSKNARTRTGQK